MSQGGGFRKGLGIAYRLGTELLVATMLGAAMGYALDRAIGSEPWFLVAGILLGGAAGCLNVFRAFQEIVQEEDQEEKERTKERDD
ncbi:MAG: AtpZ/AtpI family protein [Nitrospinae bacterium]|nr:AtpZ/AtpI family protein [Nitrospinota bacterium]